MMSLPRKGSILIVDDNQLWRELLIAILENDGHEVTSAASFEAGRMMLMNKLFDIVILDMRLVDRQNHNVQGMALLEEAKKLNSSVKAIILTGYPDPDQRARAINFYRADGYLEKAPDGKPFDVDAFSQYIFALLNE
jgi:DNA-binding NtrC family response regulator